MSYAYRVQWVKRTKTVTSKDTLTLDIDMLSIVSDDEMKSLLKNKLKEDRWRVQSDGSLKSDFEGLTLELDDECRALKVTSQAKKKVQTQASTKHEAQQNVRALAHSAQDALDGEVANRLMRSESKVREHLQASLQDVYLQALEIKAKRMGDVESVQRQQNDDGSVEIVIKIKS